jgi:hypothetical protein
MLPCAFRIVAFLNSGRAGADQGIRVAGGR